MNSAFRFLTISVLALAAATILHAQNATTAEPAAPERDGGWFAMGVGPSSQHDVSLVVLGSFGRERFVQIGLHNSANILGSSNASAAHLGIGLSDVGTG